MLQTQGRAPIDDCHRFSDLHYPGQKQVAALSLVALAPAPSRGKQKLIGEVFRSSPPIEAQADGSSTATFKIDSTPFAVHGSTTNDKVFNNSTQAFRKVMLGSGGSVVGITRQDGAVVWDDASTKGQTTEAKGGFEFRTEVQFATTGRARPLVHG
ncbi:hypothetical protein CGCA056_v002817 [Colletotrichum aenigma]|uniref:uncharacterized protein n=1 Tax=Colletotrichum aenigma TaxID=1215731 RepID=UPI0018724BFC|nr:uncharacterized protein CGCA056_v002817 [Colletotrichum aenigma]KAF5526558.1 hypothetical protein CGCA056_v002817 [Colletotrichum aenigma]